MAASACRMNDRTGCSRSGRDREIRDGNRDVARLGSRRRHRRGSARAATPQAATAGAIGSFAMKRRHQSARFNRYQSLDPCAVAATRAASRGSSRSRALREPRDFGGGIRAQIAFEHFIHRHAEALLRPIDDAVRNQAAHGLLENVLERAVLDLQRRWNAERERDERVIEKRHPPFERPRPSSSCRRASAAAPAAAG